METVSEEERMTRKLAFKYFQKMVQESFTAANLGGEASNNF